MEADDEPWRINRVILVARVPPGTFPAESTGLSVAPVFADVTGAYEEDGRDGGYYSLDFYFDEGLAVLRRTTWISRETLEEVLTSAELCGVPRNCWQPTSQDWPDWSLLPEALQPSDGPRLKGQVSYFVAFWPSWAAAPDETGRDTYERLSAPGSRSEAPDRLLARFLDAALTAYPATSGPDHPWFIDPTWSIEGRFLHVDITFKAVSRVLPRLSETADQIGLTVYDPQTQTVYRAS